jgi:uncharacterized protein with PIN domain
LFYFLNLIKIDFDNILRLILSTIKMGLYLSHNNTEEKFCLICWNSIDNNRWTKCLSCNIILHDICEETYRGERGYCKCPHCQKVGSLGTYAI